MKKIISVLLASLMLLGMLSLTGCQSGSSSLKLGLGLSNVVSATSATEDVAGEGKLTVTAAAVLVDDAGKIVKAFIDCADTTVAYNTTGGVAIEEGIRTKYESGKDYGMVAYGGAAKEWYEQADAFCALIVGKTAAEVKALVAADAKGTEEVINAGCTVYVSDFAVAVENAIANAVASNATKDDTVKLGVSINQSETVPTEDAPGALKVEVALFAAAVGADNKITAAYTDTVEASFGFDINGQSTFDASKALLSKRAQGDAYGMKSEYGSTREWYEHAAAFDAACIGKTAGEIPSLMGEDSKGNADLQAAGCTIYVSSFVKAASKIG